MVSGKTLKHRKAVIRGRTVFPVALSQDVVDLISKVLRYSAIFFSGVTLNMSKELSYSPADRYIDNKAYSTADFRKRVTYSGQPGWLLVQIRLYVM